ncbi:MAG: S24 family peptidase [Rhodomicrobium sp.]
MAFSCQPELTQDSRHVNYLFKIIKTAPDMPQLTAGNLNQRIRFARKRARLSLREVGAFFDPPISAQAVRAWEREDKPSIPELWRLEVLAANLSVNYHWLTTGSGSYEVKFPRIDNKDNFVPLIKLADVSVSNIDEVITKALSEQSVKPSFWNDDRERFASEILGTSMSPFYNEGDIIYFLRGNKADPGDYVAAEVPSLRQTLFRKFRYNEQGQVVLEPENKNWPPLMFDEEGVGRDVHILGVLCGHFARR